MSRLGRRRLIVNADDFGGSPSINEAVMRAHDEGILTSASLMVNEPGFAEAARYARDHPRLGVGLHLTLLQGRAALDPDRIPGLVDGEGRFTDQPVVAGWRYFFQGSLRDQLRSEIAAQFDKFRTTGLPLDHVNGHLHLHLHPVVFRLLMDHASQWGITGLRCTRDPFGLNARLAPGRWMYRCSHAVIFGILSARARPILRQRAIKHTDTVFGLLQQAAVDQVYVQRLLSVLPPGDSELYSHPSLGQFEHELDALISPRVRAQVIEQGIQLIRYQDL